MPSLPLFRRVLLLLVLCPLATAGTQAQTVPEPGEIVINEIYYDPPDEQAEFIELYNRSDGTFDLSVLLFSDSNRDLTPVTDAPTPLPPGGYAVLTRDSAAFKAAFPGAAFTEPESWHVLNNGGDTVLLYGPDSTEIDAVPYEPGWGGDDNFSSLERIDPAGPSGSAFNFGSSTDPRGATPGARNSLFDPDETGPQVLFVEQAAPAAADVFFDEPVADPAPPAFTLQDDRSPERLEVRTDGTRARLFFAGALGGPSLTVEGVRDRTGNAAPPQTVPLAYLAQPDQLIINEIMYDPLADDFDGRPNQPEYFELYNRTERSLTLRRHYWTDRPDERSEADTMRLGSSFLAVPPGGYALVFARSDDTALQEAFPEIDFAATDSLALAPISSGSLGLLNSGDLIALHRPDDTRLDAVAYDPDWHSPSLRDAKGVSLERLDPAGSSGSARNWTSSVAEAGGTPGRPNATALPETAPPAEPGLAVEPSPFSPDGDGFEDRAVISYTLTEPATLVRVRIFDSYGRHVRTLEEARLAGTTGQLVWDGLDDDRHSLRIGIYIVLLEAVHAESGAARVLKAPVVLARPLD